jgi:hypothetical protein
MSWNFVLTPLEGPKIGADVNGTGESQQNLPPLGATPTSLRVDLAADHPLEGDSANQPVSP